MTTLCALQVELGGPIWIGSDRQLTCGNLIETTGYSKWRYGTDEKIGPWGFGASGECALVDFASEILLAELDADQDWPYGLVRTVCESLRKRLDDIHWSSDAGSGGAPHRHSTLVAVVQGALWDLDMATGWALKLNPGEFVAAGSGREVALGAGEALKDLDPESRLRRSIEIAIRYDTHSGGDPWVYCLG